MSPHALDFSCGTLKLLASCRWVGFTHNAFHFQPAQSHLSWNSGPSFLSTSFYHLLGSSDTPKGRLRVHRRWPGPSVCETR
ncbi:hypothetical protein PITC_096750 [Penicillium italicum]|uniref:Uncharacterized protein n=1 Tax=Penicillium italicum TaxID=40296 RepID=A0A0A2KTN4_PENIT|nr:hypothetical protein PITC_096750 [Penicillium italicum]